MMTFKFIISAYVWMMFYFNNNIGVHAKIGMNWGRQSKTKMIPSMVVDLLLQNKVPAVKITNTDDDIIRAFSGTNIEVTITITNFTITIPNLTAARKFVYEKIKAFPTVNFRYVLVGYNAIANVRFYRGNLNAIVDALKIMQNALDDLDCGHIKAILSHSYTGTLKQNITNPSIADFLDDVKQDIMPQILEFINKTGAPFFVDIFPISFIKIFNLDVEFAFFENKSTYVTTDINGFKYNNFFDYAYDSFVWALKKLGYENIKIVMNQVGWPTDGYYNCSVDQAERFWKGFLPLVTSNRGTPMRPGAPIDIFIHSLTDEKMNLASLPFSRHWGIYRSNGEPKYKIDLSGQGRDIFPTSAKGISLMPGRWCVFNGDNRNITKVQSLIDFACTQADCTSLEEGGSCSMLSFDEKASYAFNSYFQNQYQNEKSCVFDGFGKVTMQNPSKYGCVFIVEVIKGNNRQDT